MSFSEFMEDFFENKSNDIQLGLIATIENFDKAKMRADVQPLLKLKNALDEETDLPVLSDLPVMLYRGGGFYIRPTYEKGDYVWIAFSTFDIADSLNGYSRAASTKIFSIENACVIGGIGKNNFVAPTEFNSEDGLIIGHNDGNSYMVFKDDSIVFNFGKGVEEITFSKTGIETRQQIKAGLEVSANNLSVPNTLSKHFHTGNLGNPTSTPTPGT